MLEELCAGSNQVVATGGGAFMNPVSRQAMLERGLVLCLNARPETIFQRLGRASPEANDGQAIDEGGSENYPDGADRTDRTGKQEARPVRPLLSGGDTL